MKIKKKKEKGKKKAQRLKRSMAYCWSIHPDLHFLVPFQ
jgi:hypothetical protein